MIGAVRGIDPESGHYYDDTKRYIDATPNLDATSRQRVYEGNARRVYPRLDAVLNARHLRPASAKAAGAGAEGGVAS
jgi:4-oxalmesaconate hydratase